MITTTLTVESVRKIWIDAEFYWEIIYEKYIVEFQSHRDALFQTTSLYTFLVYFSLNVLIFFLMQMTFVLDFHWFEMMCIHYLTSFFSDSIRFILYFSLMINSKITACQVSVLLLALVDSSCSWLSESMPFPFSADFRWSLFHPWITPTISCFISALHGAWISFWTHQLCKSKRLRGIHLIHKIPFSLKRKKNSILSA